MHWEQLLTNLAIGLFGGLSTSLGTYAAKMKTEPFSAAKFGRTMAAGVGAGLASTSLGIDITSGNLAGVAQATGLSLGLVNTIDQGVKFIWRLFSKRN